MPKLVDINNKTICFLKLLPFRGQRHSLADLQMLEVDDDVLLKEYVEHGSEEAFAIFVASIVLLLGIATMASGSVVVFDYGIEQHCSRNLGSRMSRILGAAS